MNVAQSSGGVSAYAWDYPHGHVIDWHSHPQGQLVYAAKGAAWLVTARARYVLPPFLAAWIPPHVEHLIEARGAMWMRTAYVAEHTADVLPGEVRVFAIHPLLRELLLSLIERSRLSPSRQEGLVAILFEHLSNLPALPLTIPWPRDSRLRRIALALDRNPGLSIGIEELARQVGTTKRTVSRLFPKETGLTFSVWRQRLRFLRAVELLTNGNSVTNAAADVGYGSPSAFIARFRAMFGDTPRTYIRRLSEHASGFPVCE